MQTPILFMFFNRKSTAIGVFEEIRRARPTRLYLACDGARISKAEEAAIVDDLRSTICAMIDWECNVQTRFLNTNAGCKMAVSGAIDWLFENESEGIILEDDCLPDPSFFGYCEELLYKYRSDDRIMCISGDRFSPATNSSNDTDYTFSKYIHIWGWATWRRAWGKYNVNIESQWNVNGEFVLKQRFPNSPKDRRYWERIFSDTAMGKIDTWDHQWTYCCWENSGLSCVPTKNLITNVGFGEDATHTLNDKDRNANLSRESVEIPLRHPATILQNRRIDDWEANNIFCEDPLYKRVIRRVKCELMSIICK